ncbi:UDP-N-acetylmuramate--L-alanine ligase [Desulforamulus aeronauticus DSM 10349]|uniref:UDP-N-acetylmuramate--L-alanine ligase n=1 Tax=Desulforamulus aeronauticus DSM 10349 TaxID=1121421 RepID=A0A1M6QW85_9FIRM|nr:UDP-N-acetylmuramate--L-alanine ligase [Desulforamulus aeronauticus DSM 10349]
MQGDQKGIHFVGIGGAGMSGIATVLLGMEDYRVSGSDIKTSPVVERLEALGAVCHIGHNEANISDQTDEVVVSTAISSTNPEILEAQRRGLPLVRRGEMLARLMRSKRGIAVAGAHGKTTTTSMTALVLEGNGLDPTILIGGDLSNIGGNAKVGQGEFLVAEADESDGSFLLLNPEIAIVTNIEDDHMDYYGSQENIITAFREFLHKVPAEGLAIVCLDDPILKQMIPGLPCQVVTYGSRDSGADFTLHSYRVENGISRGEIYYQGDRLGELELYVPGTHNLLNAMATVAVGQYVGLPFSGIANALKEFRGAKRRFQAIGEIDGIKIVDDYAHHPTEIKATLQAARSAHRGRIIVVFQPHRYTRTRQLYREFAGAFNNADLLILTDIYAASETPLEGINTQLIIDHIPHREGQEVHYLATLQDAVNFLQNRVREGDLVLTMGAGDVWTLGGELLKRLEEK